MNAIAVALLLMQAAAIEPPRTVATYPFAVGERLTYNAKLGLLTLGSGSLEVASLDTLRGAETFHLRFRLQGKTIFYSLDDALESWVDVKHFNSHRFVQDFLENDKRRVRQYDIFPDSGKFHEVGRDTALPSPNDPLDDAAFFYFIRVTPLELGKTYTYQRYFRKEKNPVTVEVMKRESMEMPDGHEVSCLVLHPVIDTKGMFSKRSETRIWVTDDARRIPVQIRTKFPFGTITLRLKEMVLPTPAPGR